MLQMSTGKNQHVQLLISHGINCICLRTCQPVKTEWWIILYSCSFLQLEPKQSRFGGAHAHASHLGRLFQDFNSVERRI